MDTDSKGPRHSGPPFADLLRRTGPQRVRKYDARAKNRETRETAGSGARLGMETQDHDRASSVRVLNKSSCQTNVSICVCWRVYS